MEIVDVEDDDLRLAVAVEIADRDGDPVIVIGVPVGDVDPGAPSASHLAAASSPRCRRGTARFGPGPVVDAHDDQVGSGGSPSRSATVIGLAPARSQYPSRGSRIQPPARRSRPGRVEPLPTR